MTVERQNIFGTVKVNENWMNPVSGIITSLCGYRKNPVLNVEEIHEGIDIACPAGTEVIAVRSGTVTAVGVSKTYGNFLKYRTDDGYTIMFAHLKKSLVKEKSAVEQGQIVALSGNSGLTTGAHLHYGMWKDGNLVDPEPYLNLAYTEEVRKELLAKK